MKQNVAPQISPDRAINLREIRIIPQVNLSQPALLAVADAFHRGRFLLVMDAKTGEESR